MNMLDQKELISNRASYSQARAAVYAYVMLVAMCGTTSAGDWVQAAGQYNSAGTIQELIVWNSNIYAGTGGSTDGGLLLKYNSSGSQWDLAASQLNGQDYIYDLIIYDSNIYAGTRDNGASTLGGRLFMFDEPNSTWVQKAGNLNSQEVIVTLHEFNNSLWGGTAHGARLFKWNEVDTWIQMAGQYGSEIELYRLFDYNNTLYGTTASGGLLLKWSESTNSWSQQCPQAYSQNHVGAGVWRDDIWYAGTQVNANLFNWKEGNSTWTRDAPQFGSETHIYTCIEYEGDIYGGTIGGGKLLKWDNVSAWTEMASQYGSEVQVYDLVVFNGEIYGSTNPNGMLLRYTPPYTPDTGSYTYAKKKSIPVCNTNTTYNITNYSISINVSWESGMNSDFSDIIAKNENTGVWLEGCIDRKSDGNWADFWFKADNVTSGWNNATFYLYFDSASPKGHVCSRDRTFKEHNTFESDLEGFDTGTRDNTYSYDGSYSYLPPTYTILSIKTTKTGETEPQIVEYEYYLPSGETGTVFYGYHGFDSAAKSLTSGLGAINSLEWSYYQTYPSTAWIDTGVVSTTETWHTMSYVHNPDGTYAIMHNGTIEGSGFYRGDVQDTHLSFTKFDGKLVYIDNIRTRKWNTDPPAVGPLGPTSDTEPTYIPPTPTTLANTTGNFWVNHTWSAGSGNVTDSYNVSQNGTWYNTTTTPHFNATSVGAHGYSDITVYAFNSSSTGTLSAGNITQNTTVPNNAITITNTSDWSGSTGSNVYVDYDATDADSDTPTFSCNRTDLFTDFSTSTGKGNWTATAGTYYVDFGVSDGYGSTSNYTMTITVSAVAPIITLLSQNPSTIFQNTTGYLNISYGISHDSAGLNNTSVSFIFRNYDHTLNDANHSIRPPSNDKCEMWNFDGQIMRAANRNETLNFENNDTITGGNSFTWSGLDENNTRLTIVPVNSTYTIVQINGTAHDLAMEQMWYLDRTDMVESPKTQLAIHKSQDVVIKFWNAEIFKGNYDFIGMGYTDTSLESAPAAHPSDANPVSFYYLNSSYDPLGGVDPLDSAVFMGSLNATQWVDHVYSPDQNASYVRGAINNTLLNSVINTTEISYLYFKSNTPSSKPYYINITDSSTNTNRTFGQTDVLWIGNDAPYTAHPYTPNVWYAFVYDNTSFDHKLYVADNNGRWGNGTLQSTNIGAGLFPPTKPSINHFHFNGSDDYDINKTYSGTVEVYIGVGTDPDGGTVTHNLTLHYKNQTLVAIINNTFTDTDIIGNGVYAEISFNTTPYYSETEEYTLKVVATDDEGETSESWSCCNFTLGTHQISNLRTTTLVYNRIVWEWINPDYYDTIMVYLDNVWKQNTTGTYYSASSLSQQTAYTIKLITVYAGVESDPATDTQVTPAEQGGSSGGGRDTTPAPTATATPTVTPLPDEIVTENVSIAIEPLPEITKITVINETILATVWHLNLNKHWIYMPDHANIVACTAIPPYSCRYYEDQKKFEIVIDGESPDPIFTADQWVTFITRDGERISQHIRTKVYNPLFYLTFTPTSASVTGVMRYFVHGDENTMDGIRVWWLGLLGMGLIVGVWRRKK